MTNLKHPAILTDLGHVGEKGLPVNEASWFQQELELCREWGFKLETAGGRVRLQPDPDALVPYWVQKETPAIAWDWLRIQGFLSVDSTNREALEQARQGAPGGTLVYAEEQTAGRGRRGRAWFSPAKTGLYFSLILRPARKQRFWPILTHVASVALADTLKMPADKGPLPGSLDIDLKWPNDVMISGKKCAGILLETHGIEGEYPAAVVGMGINVHKGSVPGELASEATSLEDMAGVFIPRRRLLVCFLHQFQHAYRMFDQGRDDDILDRWKSYSSMWNGAPITVIEGDRARKAVTCGLNEMGALLIRTGEGETETLLAGDIRIRQDMGRENS